MYQKQPLQWHLKERPEAFSLGNLSHFKRITSQGLNSFSYLFLKLDHVPYGGTGEAGGPVG